MNQTQLACKHEQFKADCRINRLEDTGRFCIEVKVHCEQCGLPFHFPGLPHGILLNHPSVNPDKTEFRCPIIPGAAEIIPHTSTFQMPDLKERN
jgi:hypothetical protein